MVDQGQPAEQDSRGQPVQRDLGVLLEVLDRQVQVASREPQDRLVLLDLLEQEVLPDPLEGLELQVLRDPEASQVRLVLLETQVRPEASDARDLRAALESRVRLESEG